MNDSLRPDHLDGRTNVGSEVRNVRDTKRPRSDSMVESLSVNKLPSNISRAGTRKLAEPVLDQPSESVMRDALHRSNFSLDSYVLSRIKMKFQGHFIGDDFAVVGLDPGRLENGTLSADTQLASNSVTATEGGLNLSGLKRIGRHFDQQTKKGPRPIAVNPLTVGNSFTPMSE